MKCSIEISYYPLADDFKPVVKAFIADLQRYPAIKVEPGSISTRLFGEYRDLMQALTECMERSFEGVPSCCVIKILNLNRDK